MNKIEVSTHKAQQAMMSYSQGIKADGFHFIFVNEIYRKQFKAPFPARSVIQVLALPMGSNIEAEAFVCIS